MFKEQTSTVEMIFLISKIQKKPSNLNLGQWGQWGECLKNNKGMNKKIETVKISSQFC